MNNVKIMGVIIGMAGVVFNLITKDYNAMVWALAFTFGILNWKEIQ